MHFRTLGRPMALCCVFLVLLVPLSGCVAPVIDAPAKITPPEQLPTSAPVHNDTGSPDADTNDAEDARAPPARPDAPPATAVEVPLGTPRLLHRSTPFFGNQHGGGYGSLAVGINGVLASSHDDIGLFDKQGTLIQRMQHFRFFASVLPEGHGLTDPRVSYDHQTGRFFAVAASGVFGGCPPNVACENYWTLAISRTNDPRTLRAEDWYFWVFDATVTDGQRTAEWGDFSVVSVSDDILVLNGNMVHHVEGGAEAVYDRFWVFDKQAMLDGRAVEAPASEFASLKDPRSGRVISWKPVPATHLDNAGGVYAVTFGLEDCDLIVLRIDGPADHATARVHNVRIPERTCRTYPLALHQLGDPRPLYANPHITSPPVYVNGSLWVAQAVPIFHGTHQTEGVRVVRIDVSAWPQVPRIVEDTWIDDADESYAYPALAVDRLGNIGLVVNVVRDDAYISTAYTGRLRNADDVGFRPMVVAGPGGAVHDYPDSGDRLRFGGYSGAALDPADGTVWFLAQTPVRPCTWGMVLLHAAFEEGGIPTAAEQPAAGPAGGPCIRPNRSAYDV